jgi:uncharacterized protein YndB with AHSA1/START domain
MSTEIQTGSETATDIELRHRVIASGDARCAVFRRHYDADIADVWDACTNPARLGRWYAPVEGDLRVGGHYTQGDFGPGFITRCEAPNILTVELGGGDPATDQIELRLSEGADGTTVLEFEHATTLDSHEIGGEIYDAVYCMGGGYGPRMISLEQHLNGTLPDLNPAMLHTMPEFGPAIQGSMAILDELVKADKQR